MMQNASKDFINAMMSNVAEPKIKLELLDSDNNIIDEITESVDSDNINDISVDTESDIRRTFTMTLNNHSGKFTWQEDGLIWINRKKIKLYIGFETPNGIEYVPEGVFVLTQPQSTDSTTELNTVISGQDQWYWLTGNFGKYSSQITYSAYEKDSNGNYIVDSNGDSQLRTEKDSNGNTIYDTNGNPVYYRITNYIRSILENAGFASDKILIDECNSYLTTDMTYDIGDNRGDAIKDLVAKCYSATDDYFYEAYFDVNGYFRFQKKLKPSVVAPCWTYEITDNTMYAGGTRSLVEDNLFNHILVLGGTNDTMEFRSELIVDETAYECNKYGDSTKEEFGQGTFSNTEADVLGKLTLLEGKESTTLSDGTTTKIGTGVYDTNGTFISRWFDISSDYTYKESYIDWLQVIDSGETLSLTVEFSNDKSTILGSGSITNKSTLPYLTVGSSLPHYMRYKVSMSSTDSSKTPVLTNLQFSITVNNLPWANHPYSIQKIGDRMYFWNGGIDSNIDTQSQCNARAKYELNQNLIYTEKAEINILPNYLHEGNDVIAINDDYNGCSGNYQLISFSIPIKAALMPITAKKIREVS